MNTENIISQFKLFWQYPVITEKIFYQQEKNNPLYFGFPWATIIDKNYNLQIIYKILYKMVEPHKTYYTCCQHIYFQRLLPLFKALNIVTVFTPHKISEQHEINGVNIKECPLYAVNVEDVSRNDTFQNVNFLTFDRKLLYSFAGGYQPGYMSDIRKNIFTMKHPKNCIIKNTGDWHFNRDVYHTSQNVKGELNEDSKHKDKTRSYNELLLNSRYSLCPSGSGPNSIRFWEALGVGSIPILLSDKMTLPEHKEWDNAILKIKEKDLEKIPEILSKISIEKENEMREKCIQIYEYFKINFRNNKVPKILFTSYICDKSDDIVSSILKKWEILNPDFKVLYFSDNDVKKFFSGSKYYESYKKLKNGVAIADFFRICYIQENGGYWFDIDLEPFTVLVPYEGNIHLFDCGFKNISYMFIGGISNELYETVIQNVEIQIDQNYKIKTKHIMDITGPRIIQNIILSKLNLTSTKDGCLPGSFTPKTYLKNTPYKFQYLLQNCTKHKSKNYEVLQKKYNKKNYEFYNYI